MKIKNISKKALAVVMSLAVLASALMLNTFSAFADGEGGRTTPTSPTPWSGKVADGFAGGDGSVNNPYQIATAEEFAYFGTLLFTGSATSGKYFKLTNDIYLNDINSTAWQKLMADNEAGLTEEERATLNEWNVKTGRAEGATPEFNGHFDGDYHVIKGFYTNSYYKFMSIFGKMGWGFRGLKNLGIESSYISSTWDVFSDSGKNGTGYVAPFFSNTHNVLDGGITSKSIENCYAADSVILKGQLVGCFIGLSEINPDSVTTDVEIKNCYTSAQSTSTATVWGGARHASFIAAYYYAAGFKFTNCYSTCNLPIFTGVDGGNYNKYNTADNNYRASTSCTNCYALQDNAKYPGFKKLTSGYMYGLKAENSMSGLFGTDSPWVALLGNTPKLKAFGYEVLTMWDGETTYAPMAVSDTNPGTEENPYLIYDAAELAYVASQIQISNVSSYYELRNDIYLNNVEDENWKKLVAGESLTDEELNTFNKWNYGNCEGNDGRYGLSGRIDGNNHVIRGVYAVSDQTQVDPAPTNTNGKTTQHAATFRGILQGGSIIDLGIESSYFKADVSANARAGAFIAYVQVANTQWDNAKITGCYVDNTYIYGKQKAGGLIGFSEVSSKDENGNPKDRELIIENCYSNATLSGGNLGNFIGYAGFGDLITVKNCYGTQDAAIIGSFYKKGDIETDGYVNCYRVNSATSTINGITHLTSSKMIGKKATVTMSGLFGGENSAWVALAGKTPKLKAFGYDDSVVWDGTTTYAPIAASDTGAGTSTNPYLIFDAEELAYVANLATTDTGSAKTNNYYCLKNDIYLNDITTDVWNKLMAGTATEQERATLNNWTYGGYNGGAGNIGFKGHLNGNNYAIKGVYLYNTELNSAALLRGITGGSIENLSIKNSYYESTKTGYIAPLVGYGIGAAPTIRNCYVAGDVAVKAPNGMGVGLICQHEINIANAVAGQKLVIENCYTEANITAKSVVSILGSWYFSCGLEMKNCYGTQNAALYGNQNNTQANNYATQAETAGKTVDVQSWFENCYSLKAASYNKTGSATINLDNVTVLTLADMKGANATTAMARLFTNGANSANWFVMTGKTPELFCFSGRTEIKTGDVNVDDKVDLLDLVDYARARANVAGVVINESNDVITGTFKGNTKAALKRNLLGERFDEISFPTVQ